MVLVGRGRERGRGREGERDEEREKEGLPINWFIDCHPSVPLVPGGGEVIEMDHVIKLAPSNHNF